MGTSLSGLCILQIPELSARAIKGKEEKYTRQGSSLQTMQSTSRGLFSHLQHHDHPPAPQPLPQNDAAKLDPAKTERAPSPRFPNQRAFCSQVVFSPPPKQAVPPPQEKPAHPHLPQVPQQLGGLILLPLLHQHQHVLDHADPPVVRGQTATTTLPKLLAGLHHEGSEEISPFPGGDFLAVVGRGALPGAGRLATLGLFGAHGVSLRLLQPWGCMQGGGS